MRDSNLSGLGETSGPAAGEAASPGASTGSDDAARLAALAAEAAADEGEPEGEPGAPAAAGDGFIGRDAFAQLFASGFAVGGHVTGLRTLQGVPERPETRPASDAIYDIVEEVPALHFMIRPGGKWVERAMILGAFAVPVATGVAAELAERKAPRKAPGQNPHSNATAPAPATAPEDHAAYDGELRR